MKGCEGAGKSGLIISVAGGIQSWNCCNHNESYINYLRVVITLSKAVKILGSPRRLVSKKIIFWFPFFWDLNLLLRGSLFYFLFLHVCYINVLFPILFCYSVSCFKPAALVDKIFELAVCDIANSRESFVTVESFLAVVNLQVLQDSFPAYLLCHFRWGFSRNWFFQ